MGSASFPAFTAGTDRRNSTAACEGQRFAASVDAADISKGSRLRAFGEASSNDSGSLLPLRRDRIFTTEFLASAAAVADHLPDVLRELICAGSLITRKGDRIGIAPGSSLRAFAPVHHLPLLQTRCFCPSSPALLPTLKASNTRFQRGEKGASLENAEHEVKISVLALSSTDGSLLCVFSPRLRKPKSGSPCPSARRLDHLCVERDIFRALGQCGVCVVSAATSETTEQPTTTLQCRPFSGIAPTFGIRSCVVVACLPYGIYGATSAGLVVSVCGDVTGAGD